MSARDDAFTAIDSYAADAAHQAAASQAQGDQAAISAANQHAADVQAAFDAYRASHPDTQPPPPPPSNTLKIGGRAKDKPFPELVAALGPIQCARAFYPDGLPAAFDPSSVPSGAVPWVSCKRADVYVEPFAKSMPAGSMLTLHHEAEQDETVAAFLAEFDPFAQRVHAANPKVKVAHIAGSFAYRNGGPGTSGGYLSKQADLYTIDSYQPDVGADGKFVPLSKDPRFQTWYAFVKATGKACGVTEYGRGVVTGDAAKDAATARARIEVLALDVAYLRSIGAVCLQAWWTGGSQGQWRFDDKPSQDAWRALSRP